MFEKIAFATTDGVQLRGRYYRPEGRDNPPLIIISGGLSSVIDLRLTAYAEAFAAAGLAALVYDHRNFGESDGAIRQEIDPHQQISDTKDAITFALSLPDTDPGKIGVWGSSYGGGHAIVLAATDRRISCAVAQVPFISGSQTLARLVRSDFHAHVQAGFAADRAARLSGAAPQMIPVAAEGPFDPAALPTSDAWPWREKYKDVPNWRNEITLRSMELAGGYEPGAYAALVSPTPLLLIIAKNDFLCPPDLARAAYERAFQPKGLVTLAGGHFDPYDDQFEQSSSAATSWFREHLG